MSLTVHTPAVYQIRLQGTLSSAWADCLSGMAVVNYWAREPEREAETMLVGLLPDQTALAGVLNLAQSLGMPLLDVRCLGPALER